ncbi:MAG TPA: M14 family zinc carboxypeptidase [Longimicrobiales bacterium]|jgi:hypothetical protein
MRRKWAAAALAIAVQVVAPLAHLATGGATPGAVGLAAQEIPSPEGHLGFSPGEDRKLATWDQLAAYYDRLARVSPRVSVDTLGATTMGRPFVMLTITGEANHARLEELHRIQMKLADPRTVSGPAELERLLDQGRTVVLITHQIHSTEVGGGLAAARLAHRLATSDAPEIREILDNVILLQIPSLNPDGTQWVTEWYREHVGTPFEGTSPPWLYHFYVGHDNNRDWYAFTQEETRLTVTGAHNAWHPQIVHDIHQMGSNGARIFFPPFIDPWEPNIDPGLTAAVNQLGAYMAAELTAQGKPGVVIGATYDAFTPARAYQHYHGGARILSETASARLATPVDIPREAVRGGRGFDAAVASWNFPMPWEGGEWALGDIVDYMEAGALALLSNAARNRRYWLENFYGVGRRAVEGWDRWPAAWVIPASPENLANRAGLDYVLRILALGDVEVRRAEAGFSANGEALPRGSWVVPMRQPYASFAQTLIEVQEYPDLREYPGGPPQRPYDVTAHTLPLLMGVDAIPLEEAPSVALSDPIDPPDFAFELPPTWRGDAAPRVAIYKSWQEPMEAGWTRWVFDRHGMPHDTLHDADIRAGGLAARYDAILLQNQSPESIRDGVREGSLPSGYTGGLGEAGVRALRDFVRSGGRLVAVEAATDFVAELFDLAVSSATERLPIQDFYVPGSLVGLELEEHPVTAGVESGVAGWYWRSSRAFQVGDPTVRIVARYAEGNPVLSGWILGPEHLAGRPAIVQATVGQGDVVLFGFQPNYRAQSVATWPLLFNSLAPLGDASQPER